MEIDKDFYTIKELSIIFGVRRQTVHNWVKNGMIDGAYRIGRNWAIPIESIKDGYNNIKYKDWTSVNIPNFLTAFQAAQIFGIFRSTVIGLCRKGIFPNAEKRKGVWIIPYQDIIDNNRRKRKRLKEIIPCPIITSNTQMDEV